MVKSQIRKQERIRFIQRHQSLINAAIIENKASGGRGKKGDGLTDFERQIVALLRKEVGYSATTSNTDLICSILRLSKQLKKEKNEVY